MYGKIITIVIKLIMKKTTVIIYMSIKHPVLGQRKCTDLRSTIKKQKIKHGMCFFLYEKEKTP